MNKKGLMAWVLAFCMISIFVQMPVDVMAALDDVYYQETVNYGNFWNPILVDGYYCELYSSKAIYATECKGTVLEFPTTLQYNHKTYKIREIHEVLARTEEEVEAYKDLPGFQNKDSVEKIIIPNGIKQVYLRTLHTWKNLKEICIPESVVGKALYLSHTNGKVVIDKKNKKYQTSGNGVYTKDTKKLRATFGTKKTFTIKKGTKSVEWEAFLDYKKLKKVIVPASVKTLNLATFQGCKNLKSITFQGKKAPSFSTKINLKSYYEEENMILTEMPKKVTVYVKNKKVKKSIEKTLKIGDLKKLKWKVKVKK